MNNQNIKEDIQVENNHSIKDDIVLFNKIPLENKENDNNFMAYENDNNIKAFENNDDYNGISSYLQKEELK